MKLAATLIACILSTSAVAADLACSSIRFVVPFPPGGPTDVGTRLVGDAVASKLGKTVVVENKAGASGIVGTEYVLGSKKDGCTILANSTSMAMFPDLFSKLKFDPFKDLVVLGAIGVTPTFVVTANKSIGDLKDLLQWSRRKEGGLSYGIPGVGVNAHLAMEEIQAKTGAKLQHVPYRGASGASSDLISGRIDFGAFASAGAILQLVKQGQIKAVSVIQPKRSLLVPDIETTAEQGLADLDASVPFLFFVPNGTPDDVVAQLGVELNEAAARSDVSAKLPQLGFEPLRIGPAEGAVLMRNTADQWSPVIKRLGLKLN